MRAETHFYRIIRVAGDLAHVALSERQETDSQLRIYGERIRHLEVFRRPLLTEHLGLGTERDELVVRAHVRHNFIQLLPVVAAGHGLERNVWGGIPGDSRQDFLGIIRLLGVSSSRPWERRER